MGDWLERANRILGDLAGEAGRQAEIVKLQAKLGSLEDDLDEVYVEAGKRAEELAKARQIRDEQLGVILERARKIKEEMMDVREAVQQARQKPEGDEKSEGGEAESSPQSQPQPTPTAEATVDQACPSCGGEVTTHMVFCPHGGEKVREAADE